jgi:hypothetical protein
MAVSTEPRIARRFIRRPPADQWEGRAVQPHSAHRVGLRHRLDQQRPAHRHPGQLAGPLQHCPQPLRPRRSPTDQPTRSEKPFWSRQLAQAHAFGRQRPGLPGHSYCTD